MTVYLSSVFSPNMFPNRLKTVTVFTRISEKKFIQELREAYFQNSLVNIINHRDTIKLINKIASLKIKPDFQEIVMTENDKMLLVTIKDKHKHKSVREAYDRGFVRFYRMEVVL